MEETKTLRAKITIKYAEIKELENKIFNNEWKKITLGEVKNLQPQRKDYGIRRCQDCHSTYLRITKDEPIIAGGYELMDNDHFRYLKDTDFIYISDKY